MSKSPLLETLARSSMKIVLDGSLTLEYSFLTKDELTLSENGGAAITCPYAALSLKTIVLFSHLIPNTLYGYQVVVDTKTGLATVFETWFGGYEPSKREVHREIYYGYIERADAAPPEARHGVTNRFEGKGLYWKLDRGAELLTFFPSVIWSSFVELGEPGGSLTITAPSDFIKISDELFIYSRVECEYSGTFTLEVVDLMRVRKIGVRLGFDEYDKLDYVMYTGEGKVTGQSSTFEMMNDYGTVIKLSDSPMPPMPKGERPVYRPSLQHADMTQEEIDEIIRDNFIVFEGESIMSSMNTMELSDYMVGKSFKLRFDNGGPVWEYDILDKTTLKCRQEGEREWKTEAYRAFEPAEDIILFSHIITDSRPVRCLAQAVDFSLGLGTCVDAQLGNGRKIHEVGNKALFGVLEMDGITPPPIRRHEFTTELVGKAFAWSYSETMNSIHVYSTPESYSWTIFLPNNAGGFMWSSPCFYVKLREDAYLFAWTEDTCNGNQGLMVFNPRLMHDAGFFFGLGDHDLHLTTMGAYARNAGGFDIKAKKAQNRNRFWAFNIL
jgi:hypothetical protein